MKAKTIVAMLLVVLGLAAALRADGEMVYWTAGGVFKKDIPNGLTTQIWSCSSSADSPMWVKSYNDVVYWGAYNSGQLWTSGPNGEDPHVLVDLGSGYIRNIEFYDGCMYFAEEGAGKIYKVGFDGQNLQTVISGYTGSNSGIVDFEIYDGRFYWTSWTSTSVSTCALDGQDYRKINLKVDPNGGIAFAIAIQDDHMYIASQRYNSPFGGNLLDYTMDGTSYSVLVENRNISGLDIFGDRIYYATANPGDICSVPLIGGDEMMLVPDSYPWQLDVAPEPATLSLLALGGLAMLRRRRKQADSVRRARVDANAVSWAGRMHDGKGLQ